MQRRTNFNTLRADQNTDTYLSTMTNPAEHEIYDKTVHKAIKEGNAEIIVEKDRVAPQQAADVYDEEKELAAVIIDIRQRYDKACISTENKQKAIQRLESEREQLARDMVGLEQQCAEIRQNCELAEKKGEESNHSIETLEYNQAVRLHMIQRLKQDILHYKKECFDLNVKLIRTKTSLRDISQRQTSKKHLNSKCKLVLNSLQQTVAIRQNERLTYLKEVESVLMRKFQNSALKTNREQELQNSMFNALSDRLPEEKQLIKKYYCESFLRKMLRDKMNKLMERYRGVETSFNTIRKETRVQSIKEFIDDYLNKEERYGELLESIAKAEQRINEEKEVKVELDRERAKLEDVMNGLENKLMEKQKPADSANLNKKLTQYNELVPKCKELEGIMKRWSVRTLIKFKNMADNRQQNHKMPEYEKEFNILTTKVLIQKTLSLILDSLNQKEQPLLKSPQGLSDMQTQRTQQRLNLTTLGESPLSKDYSRRNFRVRTMTAHEQTLEQRDQQYDQMSEFDFLKHNRRLVKKNNRSVRARLKTKAF